MEPTALSVALLRRRLTSLLTAMPAAQAGDEASVHRARVASRRLREALPVLGTRADAGAVARAGRRVRRITRALGPVRELDVALQVLAELEGRGAAPRTALARVRAAVLREREACRGQMLDAMTPSRLENLRKRLVGIAAPADPGPPPDASRALDDVARQAADRARRLRTAIVRAGGLYLADRLHRVRVAAKKLRYSLELQRELMGGRPTARIRRLRMQQDLLGRMHDLEILIDRTRRVQEGVAATDRRALAGLETLVRVLEDECRQGHAAYMRARPALLVLCDDVIADASRARPTAVA